MADLKRWPNYDRVTEHSVFKGGRSMKHLLTIDSFDSLCRPISQISQVVACSLVLLSLISCGSGGSGSSGTMASSGSNVVMGTMPMTATASREPLSDKRTFFAQLWSFLTAEPVAYAMSNKGTVEVPELSLLVRITMHLGISMTA
jgi:hypothetical protein